MCHSSILSVVLTFTNMTSRITQTRSRIRVRMISTTAIIIHRIASSIIHILTCE